MIDSNRPRVDRRRGGLPHNCIRNRQRVRRRRLAVVGYGPKPARAHPRTRSRTRCSPRGDRPGSLRGRRATHPLLTLLRPDHHRRPSREAQPWRRRTREQSEGHARSEPDRGVHPYRGRLLPRRDLLARRTLSTESKVTTHFADFGPYRRLTRDANVDVMDESTVGVIEPGRERFRPSTLRPRWPMSRSA